MYMYNEWSRDVLNKKVTQSKRCPHFKGQNTRLYSMSLDKRCLYFMRPYWRGVLILERCP